MRRGEPHELIRDPAGGVEDHEAALILLCARTCLTPAQRKAIDARLAGKLDWERLAQLAQRHGLAPLLHRHLGNSAIPAAVSAYLWARHEALARRNQELAGELVSIVTHLDAHGIKVVPYKGPTLALAAYGDLSLREFGDLDLLVRASDAIAVKQLLVSKGYAPVLALSPPVEEALVRSRRHYELALRHTSRRLLVELHWRSDPEFEVARLGDPQWWRDLEAIELGGTALPALPDRELLLILCLHGTKHFWSSLGWLVDVAELIRRTPSLDWTWIASTASQLGCARQLGVGLRLASSVLGAAVPASMQSFVDDPVVVACAAGIRSSMFERERFGGIARDLGMNLRLHGGWISRARFLLSAAFTPGLGEWQRWSLPRSLFFLYWPLRPLRLAEKYLLRRTPPAARPRTPPPPPRSTG